MRRSILSVFFLFATVVVSSVLTPSVAAQTFTTTLANGTELISYYRPVISASDETKVKMLTVSGNWVELDRDQVVSLDTKVPGGRGAELMADGSIRLGYVANYDASEGDEVATDPATRLLNYIVDQDNNRPDYSVDQFAEPGDAGRGGLPVSGLGAPPGQAVGSGATSFPTGSGGVDSVEPSEIQ